MIINMETIAVTRNGRLARNIVVKGTSLFIPCRAKASIAKGGLMEPTIIAATHSTPKWRGSKPSATTTGKNIGNVTTNTAYISVRHPAII